jgi:RNA polymerase sigma-70 factor, ECF subfamily
MRTLVADDAETLRALRDGDEEVFAALVTAHGRVMTRVAMTFVADRGTADEVVQEAWLGFLEGLDRFEGRASLRTWLCTIVANKARTRAVRERRCVPFSALARAGAEDDAPAVEAERFFAPDHPVWPGHWAAPPRAIAERPEGRLLARETRELLLQAIDALPERQRAVILLHDVHGATPEETCAVLGLTEGNRRVLLHRARAKVRAELEDHVHGEAA